MTNKIPNPKHQIPIWSFGFFLYFFVIGILSFDISAGMAEENPTVISNVEISSSASTETVTLLTSQKIEPRIYYLNEPTRLVMDIANAALLPGILQIPHESRWFTGVRASQFLLSPPTVRVVIDLKGEVPYRTIRERTTFSIEFLEKVPLSVAVGKGEPSLVEQLQGLLTRANTELTELEKRRWPSEALWETTLRTIEAVPFALREAVAAPRITLAGTSLAVERKRGDLSKTIYARLEDLSEQIGASYEFQKGSGTANFQLGRLSQIHLRAGDKRVFVNGESRELPVPVEAAEVKTGYELIVPLFAFAEMLGLPSTEAGGEEIVLRPLIRGVHFELQESFERIVFQFSGPLPSYPSEFYAGKEQIDFIWNHAGLPMKQNVVAVGERGIGVVKLFPLNNHQTRVIIRHTEPKSALLIPDPNENQVMILYGPSLGNVRVVRKADRVVLLAESTGRAAPEVSFLENPSRLVIDIPKHIADQKRILAEGAGLPSSVRLRGGQFSIDPPHVRLVIDLLRPVKYFYRSEHHGKHFRLTLLPREGLTVKDMKAFQYSKVLHGRVIAIEAGHGGDDPGSMSLRGISEKSLTLQTALTLARKLSQMGAIPLLTREKDVRVKLPEVVDMVNSNRVDAFLSIHYNSFVESRIGGTETYYFTAHSRRLAEILHHRLIRGIRRPDRGVRRVMFYTVHHSHVPSVLIEPVYLTHPEEAELVQKPGFHRELSWDIVRGLKDYFRGRS